MASENRGGARIWKLIISAKPQLCPSASMKASLTGTSGIEGIHCQILNYILSVRWELGIESQWLSASKTGVWRGELKPPC